MIKKGPDEKITVKPQFEFARHNEATQALQISATEKIAGVLLFEYEKGASELSMIAMQYRKTGEISPASQELIFDLLKKHKSEIIIGPNILENITKILEEFMCKIGYERFKLRQRIMSLKK